MALVVVVVMAVAAVWMAVDRTPPEWDHANHLVRAVHCAGDLARGDWQAVLERSSFYPPLVPCNADLAYGIWPSDVVGAQMVVWLFLVVGAGATYLVARGVAGNAAGAIPLLLAVAVMAGLGFSVVPRRARTAVAALVASSPRCSSP